MNSPAVVTPIAPKALQLTHILLRQYHPRIAKLLPRPKPQMADNMDVDLDMPPETISQVIAALNELGEQWLKEKPRNPGEVVRNYHRKSCLSYLLQEWIRTAENSQRYIQSQNILH